MEMTFTVEEKTTIERALDMLGQDDLSAKLRVSASPDLSSQEMQAIRTAVMEAKKNMEGIAATDPQQIIKRMDTAMAQTENNRPASPTVQQEVETAKLSLTPEEQNALSNVLESIAQPRGTDADAARKARGLAAKVRSESTPNLSVNEMKSTRAVLRNLPLLNLKEFPGSAELTAKLDTAIVQAETIQKPTLPAPSIVKEPVMIDLLTGLSNAHNAQQFTNVADLMMSVDAVEEQLNAAFAQLEGMKRQLNAFKGSVPQKQEDVVQQAVQHADQALGKVKEGLHTVKSTIVNAAKTAVKRAKSAGWGLIGKFLNFVDLPEKLGRLQNLLGSAAKTLESGIKRVELVGKEFYRADAHRDNAYRILIGHEGRAVDPNGISTGAQSVSGVMHGALKAVHKMEAITGGAIKSAQNVERFANAAEKKPSLLKKLHANQEKIASKAQPEKALAAPEQRKQRAAHREHTPT